MKRGRAKVNRRTKLFAALHPGVSGARKGSRAADALILVPCDVLVAMIGMINPVSRSQR